MDRQQNEGNRSAGTGPPTRLSRQALLGRGSIALAGTAILAVVASAIWTLASPEERSVGAAATPIPTTSATNAPAEGVEARTTIYLWKPNSGKGKVLYAARGELADPELSRDGKRLVYGAVGSDGLSQIYLFERGETERRLTNLPGGASQPTWSPDGRRIAFSGSERTEDDTDILVMDVDGSAVRGSFGTPHDDGQPDWSPDGSRITFHAPDPNGIGGDIWVASVRTRALSLLTRGPQFVIGDPAWSPDGRTIAFSGFSGTLNGRVAGSEIWLMRGNDMDVLRIGGPAHAGDFALNPSWSPDGRFIVFERDSGIGIVDPRTGHEADVFKSVVDPSWSKRGILVTLPDDGDPFEPPINVTGLFEVRMGIDATIKMTRWSCELEDAPSQVRPGELTLEFVNASPNDGMFTVVRMAPDQTVADLRADPGLSWTAPRRYVDSSRVDTWSTRNSPVGNRWAVTCWTRPPGAPDITNPVDVVAITVARGRGGPQREDT